MTCISTPWNLRGVLYLTLGFIGLEILATTYLSSFQIPLDVMDSLLMYMGCDKHIVRDISIMIFTIIVRLLMISILFHFVTIHWRSDLRNIGIYFGEWKKDIKEAIIVIIGLVLFSIICFFLLKLVKIDVVDAVFHKDKSTPFRFRFYVLSYIICACIIAPIVEEIFFRGFLYIPIRNLFIKYLPIYLGLCIAIIINALIFALLHNIGVYFKCLIDIIKGNTENIGILFQILPMFIGGILTASIFERRKSVLAPIIIHSIGNIGVLFIMLVLVS